MFIELRLGPVETDIVCFNIEVVMEQENKSLIIRRIFKEHNNVMTTAELSNNKIFYADIQNAPCFRRVHSIELT